MKLVARHSVQVAICVATTLFLSFPFHRLHAGGGPENIAVVVNADSWASQAIANEFIHLRQIPAGNVIALEEISTFDTMKVEEFRQRILKPVLMAIEERGLKEQIDYVVYSSDFPYAIDARGDLGERKPPRVLAPTGSINGMTYLYEQTLASDIGYLQLNSNGYFRRLQRGKRLKLVSEADRKKYFEATKLIAAKDWAAGAKLLGEVARAYPNRAPFQYNLACCLAQQEGKADEAIAALTAAVAAGWGNRKHAEADEDLKSLRERKEFAALLKRMDEQAAKPFDVQPTAAFHNEHHWNARGDRSDEEGRRYLLSTMLGVTSGRGTSVSETIKGLRRSVEADYSRPNGTIYFVVNGNVRSKTREPAIKSAVAQLEKLGVQAEIVPGILPVEKTDVAGAMIGTASFDWAKSKSTMLPGAICEHLTSFGGVMREGAGQTPLSEFLRHGAAGSSGTVTEPYAIQAKFPFPFIHVHYARGCTLAEAFYQSVAGPYQLLIVGDPLCQPWARRLNVTVDGVVANQDVSRTITLKPSVTDDGGKAIAAGRLEFFIDGRRVKSVELGQPFEMVTTAVADGAHELRLVAIADDAVATQGRLVLPVRVNNRKQQVELALPSSSEIAWNKPLKLSARSNGAKSIDLMNNSRVIATIEGSVGDFEVHPLDLGYGRVMLTAIAHIDGQAVRSRPVTLSIVASPALPAIEAENDDNLTDGLLLTAGDGEPVVVTETRDAKWLVKLGVKPQQQFTILGTFSVEADDVYQFQLRSDDPIELKIDGNDLAKLAPKLRSANRWQFFPVHLQKGQHRLELSGTTGDKPSLELRFGGRGTYRLDGKRFRHVAE